MARFILSRRVALRQYETVKRYVDVVAYSYKTNPAVWEVLRETDAMVGLSSMGSARRVRELSRAIYYLQGESEEEVRWLLDSGVGWLLVDNEPELRALLGELSRLDRSVNLLVRMKMREHTVYTGKHFVYGIDWRRVSDLIPELRENPHVESLGVHFHRKTQNVGEWSLVEDLSDALDDRAMGELDAVNIGGGIPVRYANSRPNVELVLAKVGELRDFLSARGVRLMAEPGRFIAAPAVALEATVLNVYSGTAVLDCSIFNAYMDTYLLNTRLPVLGERGDRSGHRYLLKGRSPDSLDIFRYSVYLDRELRPGDKVVFLNAGAYNFHTDFNDMPRLETDVVEDFPFPVPGWL